MNTIYSAQAPQEAKRESKTKDSQKDDASVRSSQKMSKMFWLDLEMSGLDDVACRILEVAVVITDLELRELESYQAVVHQPPEVLAAMDSWCTQTHGASGLTAAVAKGRDLGVVEDEVVALLERHFSPEERVVLCGNSIGNDRRFLDRYMKKFAKRLHYRMVDVSSFKEVFRARYGLEIKKPDAHRALDDTRASVEELRYYLGFVKV